MIGVFSNFLTAYFPVWYIICTFTYPPNDPSRQKWEKYFLKKFIVKIQNISDITLTLPFTEFDYLQTYRIALQKANLVAFIPSSHLRSWQQSIRIALVRVSVGKNLFSAGKEFALMFLKSYTGLSDDGLIELLNGSIHMQIFCGDRPFQPHQGWEDYQCYNATVLPDSSI